MIDRFPSLRAIGLDTISISSFSHRDVGRAAHREFLNSGIRIIEDMKLKNIIEPSKLMRVIALPFRYLGSDGAPTTIIGEVLQ